jgi:hypothetical protein
MNISSLEEQLFSQWQGSRKGFVKDGVVSEKDYLESTPKIAFILKEVNDPDGGGWDLRKFIANGGRPQTWNNMTRWVHGIRNRNSIPNWEFYSQISNEFRKEILRSICAINLKKSPGTHTTDHASLKTIAHEDKDFIQRQYEIYDPDITICGGTGDLFKQIVGHSAKKWKCTSRGVWWYERDVNKYVISFSHPEARVHDPLLIYSLLDAVNEIHT